MQHRDKTILLKINLEIGIALNMLGNATLNEFTENEMLKRAVCMTVINIGELVKNLSEEVREQNKQIPWRNIAGFRDIAAHKYQTLKMSDVYHTVTQDFPQLQTELNQILS